MTNPDTIPSSSITLDDSPDVTNDLPNVPQPGDAPPSDQTNPPNKEPVPDADALVLELSKRGRELSAKTKAVEETRRQLTAQIERHKQFDEVLALAKTDPLTFITRMAEAAGVDELVAIEAFVAKKNGQARTLTPEERIERFEAERAAEKKAAQEREEAEAKARAEKDGEAALAGHLNSIKSFAQASKENFPLFNAPKSYEQNAVAAFDLMVLAHGAGKPISHAAAVQMIERTLQTDTEENASILGFRRNQTTTIAQPTPTVTQTPRQSQASAAPLVPTNYIRSDDEIAADWNNF